MRKLFILMSVLSIFLSACNNGCVEDLGIQSIKEVSLKPFDEIDIQGAVKVTLSQDSTYKVSIQADSAFMEYINADVSGGKLKLRLSREYCGVDSVLIRIGIGELKKLIASGAVHLSTQGKLILNDIDLSVKGSGKLMMDMSVAKLTTTLDGVADVKLIGQAGTHILKTKGTATLNSFDFVVGIYDIDIEGVGKANINVLNELKIETSGTSEVRYMGNPKKVDEKKSGATKLEKVN